MIPKKPSASSREKKEQQRGKSCGIHQETKSSSVRDQSFRKSVASNQGNNPPVQNRSPRESNGIDQESSHVPDQPHRRKTIIEPEPTIEEAGDGTVLVDPYGSVILDIHPTEADEEEDKVSFRVDSGKLASKSAYFQKLLTDTRFREASTVSGKHEELRTKYGSPSKAPVEELPHVKIVDIGGISVRKSCRNLLTDFLVVLHDLHCPGPRQLPLANVANLAVVADRFDALDCVGQWIRKKAQLTKARLERTHGEEKDYRQGLLIGMLFNNTHWVYKHSAQLILIGSKRWRSPEAEWPSSAGMWWDLPRGVEEELECRRGHILDTISSLLADIIRDYSSSERQCLAGWDTSPQCDAFQLGELIRYLGRARLFDINQAFSRALGGEQQDGEMHPWESWEVFNLIQTLRQFPQYRLDAYHTHCGPRKRLHSALNAISCHLKPQGIGICIDCWNAPPHPSRLPAWSEAEPPLFFRTAEDRYYDVEGKHPESLEKAAGEHYSAREFFTAVERTYDHSKTYFLGDVHFLR